MMRGPFKVLVASLLFLFACATQEGTTPTGISTEEHPVLSCSDECSAAATTCQEQCGGTAAECAAATAVCYDSCSRGVGSWLPC